MLRKLEADKVRSFYEGVYPKTYSIIILFLYLVLFRGKSGDYFNDILNAVISFASILLGFMGALVTLIFSLLDTKIIQVVFKNDGYKFRLKKFFLESCQSGFLVLGLSIMLFARYELFGDIKTIMPNIGIYIVESIKGVWIYLVSYFTICSYRITSLMIKIVFAAPEKEKNEEENGEEEKRKIQDLRQKYK